MIFVCTLALIQKYKEGQNAFCGHPSIRTPVHSSTQRASMKAGERQGVVEELKEFLPPPVFPSLGKGGACRAMASRPSMSTKRSAASPAARINSVQRPGSGVGTSPR